jgi:diacylglycerol kinase
MSSHFTSKSRAKSFSFAWSGFWHTLKTQPNFQIQFVIAILVVSGAFFFNFTSFEWISLIITIGLVLTAELLNTVIEVVIDLAVKEKLLPDAKLAKDVAAGAVLLMSIVSLLVGIILFWPHVAPLFSV